MRPGAGGIKTSAANGRQNSQIPVPVPQALTWIDKQTVCGMEREACSWGMPHPSVL